MAEEPLGDGVITVGLVHVVARMGLRISLARVTSTGLRVSCLGFIKGLYIRVMCLALYIVLGFRTYSRKLNPRSPSWPQHCSRPQPKGSQARGSSSHSWGLARGTVLQSRLQSLKPQAMLELCETAKSYLDCNIPQATL